MLSLTLLALLAPDRPSFRPAPPTTPPFPPSRRCSATTTARRSPPARVSSPISRPWKPRPAAARKCIEYARIVGGPAAGGHVRRDGAERIAGLDAIKADMKKLADPRGLSAGRPRRHRRIASPVITWLIHGVHGNEISSGDAAMAEAYHLLAAKNDPGVDAIMRESLVMIDPMQNPDGRARFNFQNLQGRAASPDSEPLSAEHDEPWPGGRSNHYLFDLNRDWLAITQPESAGRMRLFLEFFPQVTVDLHEMGGDATYYFPPAAAPRNPFRTADPDATGSRSSDATTPRSSTSAASPTSSARCSTPSTRATARRGRWPRARSRRPSSRPRHAACSSAGSTAPT